MAEQFIENIYRDAVIIEHIREYILYSNTCRNRDARIAYNKAAAGIERFLPELAQSDPELASKIERTALDIVASFEDNCMATGIAGGILLPLLFSYMKFYTGIEVTEGKHTLKSAQSGFLTIKDEEIGITMHSVYDPMWEAYMETEMLFDPEAECYHILGCGLGYLPYQLWKRSEGAVKLVIYEEDEVIVDYAYRYGVLSWIDDNSFEIRCVSNKEKLAEEFVKELTYDKKENRFHISSWKKLLYEAVNNRSIAVTEANLSLSRSMKDRTAINLWKNKRHEQIAFDKIHEIIKMDEWIVVSAGPSLDEQISFLKESKGIRGIVAVNTVLRRLFKEGIKPDLVAAADQYVQMREHIIGIGDQTEGIPLIAERRLNWQYLEQYRGPVCFVSAGDNRDADTEVWQVSGSVAGLALESAVRMGAKKVWLVGQDLAYPSGKTYAEGMPYKANADERGTMLVPSVDGKMVRTSEAFNWFRLGLESQIARYNGIEVYNMSQHGALIKGAKQARA